MSITLRPAALRSLALAATLALAGTSHAVEVERFEFDFTNIYSFGEKGDAGNSTLSFNIGPHARVVGLEWSLDLTAFDPSWLSEMTVEMTNDLGEGFAFRPVSEVDAPGSGSTSGSYDLLNGGLSFFTRSSGKLNLEFYEFFDDLPGAADGRWDAGKFTVIYAPVPEPATLALLAAGIVGLAALRRMGARSDR